MTYSGLWERPHTLCTALCSRTGLYITPTALQPCPHTCADWWSHTRICGQVRGTAHRALQGCSTHVEHLLWVWRAVGDHLQRLYSPTQAYRRCRALVMLFWSWVMTTHDQSKQAVHSPLQCSTGLFQPPTACLTPIQDCGRAHVHSVQPCADIEGSMARQTLK